MTRLLASVMNRDEALLACEAGADLIDCKDPRRGALGALECSTVRGIVAAVAGVRPVSATVGDLPMEPAGLARAVAIMAETGVDYVKIGFFPGPHAVCIEALARLASGISLVAVLFADSCPDFSLLPRLAGAGFRGAMLDTANKTGGRLRTHLADACLARFVNDARRAGLLAGLAGSLQLPDVAPLVALRPDYLGFRGALCTGGRVGCLDGAAVRQVCDAVGAASGAMATAGSS